jgi:hypothetical protein
MNTEDSQNQGSEFTHEHVVAKSVSIGRASPDSTHALTVRGSIHASGDVSCLSDINLKTNVVSIPDALSKVLALNGCTFEMKDNLGVRMTGLIAQDVRSVLPEAVSEGPEGLSVAYGNVVGLLVNAVKELHALLKPETV